MTHTSPAETIDPLLIELGRKYLWWRPINGQHSRDRMVAQVMNLGTYNDIRRLEKVLRPADLAKVARRAAAGWFTPRSWEFWRGRLAVSGYRIPGKPPRRSFDAPKV